MPRDRLSLRMLQKGSRELSEINAQRRPERQSGPVRCYFVKNARIVASKELPGLSRLEAIQIARTLFEESASTYDGVEVWSLTRRIFRLGSFARKPPAKPPTT